MQTLVRVSKLPWAFRYEHRSETAQVIDSETQPTIVKRTRLRHVTLPEHLFFATRKTNQV